MGRVHFAAAAGTGPALPCEDKRKSALGPRGGPVPAPAACSLPAQARRQATGHSCRRLRPRCQAPSRAGAGTEGGQGRPVRVCAVTVPCGSWCPSLSTCVCVWVGGCAQPPQRRGRGARSPGKSCSSVHWPPTRASLPSCLSWLQRRKRCRGRGPGPIASADGGEAWDLGPYPTPSQSTRKTQIGRAHV